MAQGALSGPFEPHDRASIEDPQSHGSGYLQFYCSYVSHFTSLLLRRNDLIPHPLIPHF